MNLTPDEETYAQTDAATSWLTPAYRIVSLVVAAVGLLGTVAGATFIDSMAAHPKTWLYIGLAITAGASISLAWHALDREREVAAVKAHNSELRELTAALRRDLQDAQQREQLERIESALSKLTTARLPWWKRLRA